MAGEDYGIVLDFLPKGKPNTFKPEPIAQVIGTDSFTLLEIVPKPGVSLKVGEKIYVGKEERDKVEYIKKRIQFKELTNNAISELDKTIEKIILDGPKKFLDFFNTAGSITIKRHQLELLPNLGKKHMQDILKEREKKPFESFEDIENRVHLMPNPVKTIVKRIMLELEAVDEKHYLFCRPPAKQDDRFRHGFYKPKP
ncbi:MAG: DUF655 domain-containing protein [Candidatus Diapherotrites archaeon]|nr:DUF655 domain-containing protein [Candidatus Diapherotrites archaeon]